MKGTKKGRNADTNANKKARLTRMYNRCPKIRKLKTLQQWLGMVKEVTPKKG